MRALTNNLTKCSRRLASTAVSPRPVQALPNASLETFRQRAFVAGQPATLPKGHFKDKIPAIKKWFNVDSQGEGCLADDYLASFGSTRVPLEISSEDTGSFERIEATLGYFIGYAKSRTILNQQS
jgi:hypothetical protein